VRLTPPLVSSALRKKGYAKVYHLTRGMRGWQVDERGFHLRKRQ
jgi:rhodanese-related sulfurtransferase